MPTERALRVLHAATHEHTGAGRAALRVHAAIARNGVASTMVVQHGDGSNPGVEALESPAGGVATQIRLRLERALLGLQAPGDDGYRSLGLGGGPGLAAIRRHAPDIVHLHWIPGLLGIADLPRIGRPLVWTFHDQWPVCGAEHYSDLARPREGYTPANRPAAARGPDLDRWVWQRKRRHWAALAPVIACSSRWLAEETRRSVLFGDCAIHAIPTPLDVALYQPRDRRAARQELGLPLDRRLLAFGAWGATTDRRKGFPVLREALQCLAARGLAEDADLLLFGATGREPVAGFRTHWLGHVAQERRMATIYAAADLLAIPSLQDNYPNVLAEAMACACPAVGSDVGGIPDLIQPEETGLLAPRGDAAALAAQLERLLRDDSLRLRLGEAARRKVEADCSERTVAARYRELYREALDADARRATASRQAAR